jgi:hypothetical protein
MSRSSSSILTIAAGMLVAGSVAASAVGAQAAYRPGAHSYRVDQAIDARQTVQGQMVETKASTIQLLSLSLAPASQGLRFSLVVDSASTDLVGAQPAQQEQANAAMRELKGKKVTGTVTPQGRAVELQPSDSGAASAQMVNSARGFLPKLPAGGLKAGASWNDSVTSNFNNNGIDGRTTVVSTHAVAGDTTIAGQPAWHITQKGAVRMSGTGVSQGAEVSLNGTGTVSGDAYVSKDGVYLGGDQWLTQSMTINVPAMGLAIPLEQKVTTKVRRTGS